MDTKVRELFGDYCGERCLKFGWVQPYQLKQLVKPGCSRRNVYALIKQKRLHLSREANSWDSQHPYGRAIDRVTTVRDDNMLHVFRDNPHPNVVRLFDFCSCTICMEYIDGRVFDGELPYLLEELRDICIAREIGDVQLNKYIEDVRSGLGHIHALGYVHTDIAGCNVMIARNGRAKIIDLLSCVPRTLDLEAFDWHVFANWFVKPAIKKNREGIGPFLKKREEQEQRWSAMVQVAGDELKVLTASGERLILVDEDQLRHQRMLYPKALPFMEKEGQYWGPPLDDETAIRELGRMRRSGSRLIAFAWPAFWWLDHYKRFHAHLRSNFNCVLENDRLVVFDLVQRTRHTNS